MPTGEGMSRYWERVKRNNRQYWPSMILAVAAMGAYALFGPFFGMLGFLAALVLHEYRRRQVQD
jgi:hypothetical protein